MSTLQLKPFPLILFGTLLLTNGTLHHLLHLLQLSYFLSVCRHEMIFSHQGLQKHLYSSRSDHAVKMTEHVVHVVIHVQCYRVHMDVLARLWGWNTCSSYLKERLRKELEEGVAHGLLRCQVAGWNNLWGVVGRLNYLIYCEWCWLIIRCNFDCV